MTKTYPASHPEGNNYAPLNDINLYFHTFDLGCAAALLSVGHDLISLDKTSARKVQFIFKRLRGIDTAANDYFLGKLTIKARLMFDSIKTLKNMIYSS